MGKLTTFRELTREEKLAAFEAASFLLLARILVALVPLRFWRRKFGSVDTEQVGARCASSVRLVRQAVGRAMRNAPVGFICLPQALAARWMLARRGVASKLSIGARREDGRMALHAWLTSGEAWVTGDCDPREYALLA